VFQISFVNVIFTTLRNYYIILLPMIINNDF